VPKLGYHSREDIEKAVDILCMQYLPRVFQYVSYWANNAELAEELTFKTLKKALVRYRGCYKDEKLFSTGIFASARREVQDCVKAGVIKPILPGLSTQEQEVISMKLGGMLNTQSISKILGLSELSISRIIYQSLCKLRGCMEDPK
jgi:DNA-directed RNA polymerase specialized sigma24 family protein